MLAKLDLPKHVKDQVNVPQAASSSEAPKVYTQILKKLYRLKKRRTYQLMQYQKKK